MNQDVIIIRLLHEHLEHTTIREVDTGYKACHTTVEIGEITYSLNKLSPNFIYKAQTSEPIQSGGKVPKQASQEKKRQPSGATRIPPTRSRASYACKEIHGTLKIEVHKMFPVEWFP